MLPAALCAAAVAALLLAEWRGSRQGVWLAKPLASACFLWAATGFGAADSGYGRFILCGLALCACGDVLLIPRERPAAFQAGIGAFLLGHVAYAAGFLWQGFDTTALLLAGGAMTVLAWTALRWLSPSLPAQFRIPVRVYIGVISLMVSCGIATAAGGASLLAPLGAIAFAASDLSVARDRFVAPGFSNAAWGLPLYYAAQLLLAASVERSPS